MSKKGILELQVEKGDWSCRQKIGIGVIDSEEILEVQVVKGHGAVTIENGYWNYRQRMGIGAIGKEWGLELQVENGDWSYR